MIQALFLTVSRKLLIQIFLLISNYEAATKERIDLLIHFDPLF